MVRRSIIVSFLLLVPLPLLVLLVVHNSPAHISRMQVAAVESYSLWAMPKQDACGPLHGVIRLLASAHSGPIFPPHVTVVGGIQSGRNEALSRAKQLASQLQVIKFPLRDPSQRTLNPFN